MRKQVCVLLTPQLSMQYLHEMINSPIVFAAHDDVGSVPRSAGVRVPGRYDWSHSF